MNGISYYLIGCNQIEGVIISPLFLNSYNWKTYGEMNVEFWNKHQKQL